MPLMGLVLR